VLLEELAGAALHPPARGDALQRPKAIVAPPQVRDIRRQVAHLPGGLVEAAVDFALDDDARSDAGADGNARRAGGVAGGAEAVFAQCRQVDVVLHHHREAEARLQDVFEGQVAPAQAGRPGDHALLVEGDARRAHADAAHLLAGRARPGGVLAFSMVDNSLPPLDTQKGQKLSGFAVQPVISTRSGFFLSVFPPD
jgi:hypothetical protein